MSKPTRTITLSLTDVRRLVKILDAYQFMASKASKWGYRASVRRSWLGAERRLRERVAAAGREEGGTDG